MKFYYIQKQKDLELTKNFAEIDKLKKNILDEKVIGERLNKIIDNNGNMKAMKQME